MVELEPGVASIGGPGQIQGVSPGTVTITATYNGRTASGQIQVTSGVQPPPTVTSLSITGTPCTSVGGSAQLQAIANLSNGLSQNVTSTAVWSSGNGGVATVVNGAVSCVGVGSTSVGASHGGQSAAVPVNVSAAPPVSGTIIITGNVCTAAGTTAQLQATLNGSNITSQVTWSPSSGAVATVSSSGLLSCVAAGGPVADHGLVAPAHARNPSGDGDRRWWTGSADAHRARS